MPLHHGPTQIRVRFIRNCLALRNPKWQRYLSNSNNFMPRTSRLSRQTNIELLQNSKEASCSDFLSYIISNMSYEFHVIRSNWRFDTPLIHHNTKVKAENIICLPTTYITIILIRPHRIPTYHHLSSAFLACLTTGALESRIRAPYVTSDIHQKYQKHIRKRSKPLATWLL